MRLVHRTHRQEIGKVDERLPNDETPNDETPSTQGRTEVSSGAYIFEECRGHQTAISMQSACNQHAISMPIPSWSAEAINGNQHALKE